MRIGIFTDTYPPYINGVSTSIVMLKNALEKQGHQVFVVTVNADKMSYKYEDNNKIIRIPGVPIGIYDYRLTGIYPLKAINKIKKWHLDVIHSHTEFGVGTFARIIAKQFCIPLVHTYHTMYEDYVHYITKGYFNGTSKKIVEYLTKFYCDKTATELIVPTKKTYDLFKNKYKIERNVHIIPTGIEIERFSNNKKNLPKILKLKEKYNIKDNDKVLLFVGRLGKEKSVDFLIKEHCNIIKKYPFCKLLIVGDGPDFEYFKKLVKKYKIEDNVIFTGKVPWEEVPLYYHMANIFVTASVTETQGLTVIEAMSASLPVVAINDESFNTVITNDLNGYLFNNKKEYREYISLLLNDESKCKTMSKHAKINSQIYSSKYFADRVVNVYKSAVNIENNKHHFLNKLKKRFWGEKDA